MALCNGLNGSEATEYSSRKKEPFSGYNHFRMSLLGIDPVILEDETYKSETLMGYYSDQYYTISIREEMFDMLREEVLDTLLHETHHAYVHKAVQSVNWNDKNIEENKELRLYKDLQLYKQGIENYIPADVDPDSYYNNPVEVDAREYAEEWGPKYLQYADSI